MSTWKVFNIHSRSVLYVDDFVRYGWTHDNSNIAIGYYSSVNDIKSSKNTASNLSANSNASLLNDVYGFQWYFYSPFTSSSNYLYFMRTRGYNTWTAYRINLATGVITSVNYLGGWTPPSGANYSGHDTCLAIYTEDVAYAVIDKSYSNHYEFYLHKIDFGAGTSTQIINFKYPTGYQCSSLSIHWVSSINGWRLVYPFFEYKFDIYGSPTYVNRVDWYIYDPENESLVTILYSSEASNFLYDGYNQISNSILTGNKLVTVLTAETSADKAEVHVIDLSTNTLSVYTINNSPTQEFLVEGCALDATDSCVYMAFTYWDDSYDHWYSRVYKYDPSDNSISTVNTWEFPNYETPGQFAPLQDSQHAYIMVAIDANNQKLVRLSDNQTMQTIVMTDFVCATVDEDRHGLLTSNGNIGGGTTAITIYYDDATTTVKSIASSYGYKHIYLHRERLIVHDRNNSYSHIFTFSHV